MRTLTMSKDQLKQINEQLRHVKVVQQSPPKGMTITRVANKSGTQTTFTSATLANTSTLASSAQSSIVKKNSVDVNKLMMNNRAISIKPVSSTQNQSIQSAGNQNAAAFANVSRKRTIIVSFCDLINFGNLLITKIIY